MFSFRNFTALQIGKNTYFGNEIDVVSVRTTGGLCYKLSLPKSLGQPSLVPSGMDALTYGMGLGFLMTSSIKQGIDKLSSFKLMIAAENTWQGLIYRRWPYINVPPIISADLIPGLIHYNLIDLAENDWNYISTGETSFSGCMENNEKESCLSIFDTRSMHMTESR